MGSLFLIAASWAGLANAVSLDLCATLNTASMSRSTFSQRPLTSQQIANNFPDVSLYQTNGLCQNFCVPGGYAYAITQSNNCWCSNYTPAKSVQVSTSKCSQGCPGYPDEKCGGDGVYGYVVLIEGKPSGTKGADSPTSTDVSFPVVFHCLACLPAFQFRLPFFIPFRTPSCCIAILNFVIVSIIPGIISSFTYMTSDHFRKPLSKFSASLSFIR